MWGISIAAMATIAFAVLFGAMITRENRKPGRESTALVGIFSLVAMSLSAGIATGLAFSSAQ